MKETWKDIPGYEGIYQISNFGNIKSLNFGAKNHKLSACSKNLKSTPSNCGYYKVALYSNGNSKIKYVHRLVAEAFIENPYNKSQVNHKDGNKANNNVDNLEWVSPSENQRHAIRLHLRQPSPMTGKKGKLNPNSTPILQYSLQGNFIKEWASISEAAKEYSCSYTSISNCVNNRHKSSCGYLWKKKEAFSFPLTIKPYSTPSIGRNYTYKKKTIHYGIVNAKTVSVNQFSLSGEFIKNWKSVSEAARFLNCSRYKVNRCCQGFTHSLNGYVWKYA